jgi:hypothetical protein
MDGRARIWGNQSWLHSFLSLLLAQTGLDWTGLTGSLPLLPASYSTGEAQEDQAGAGFPWMTNNRNGEYAT